MLQPSCNGNVSKTGLLIPLFLAPFFFFACQAEPTPESTYTVRDSAGVEIVESWEPAWDEGQAWTLTEEPILSIGAIDGPEEYTFYRAGSALRLEDGRILVVNGGSQEVRFYSPEGRFLHATGSDGEGPGEFRGIGRIRRFGRDSLAVEDYRLFRISLFDLDGTFGRSFRMEEGGSQLPFPDGIFADGSVLASVSWQDIGEYTDLGLIRDRLEYRRYDREGKLVSRLPTLPGWELYKGIHPDGTGYTMSTRYAVQPWVFVTAMSWYYGPGHAFEIQERDLAGALKRIIRLDRARRALPPEVLASMRTSTVSPSGGAPQNRQVPLPDSLPAHEQIVLDPSGHIWMAEYVVGEEVPLWSVFDPDGHWLGSVGMPSGGRISEIGEDYVLGTWRDDLDVQTVRVYGLVKPKGI